MRDQLSIKITLDRKDKERILKAYSAEGYKITARVLKLILADVERLESHGNN